VNFWVYLYYCLRFEFFPHLYKFSRLRSKSNNVMLLIYQSDQATNLTNSENIMSSPQKKTSRLSKATISLRGKSEAQYNTRTCLYCFEQKVTYSILMKNKFPQFRMKHETQSPPALSLQAFMQYSIIFHYSQFLIPPQNLIISFSAKLFAALFANFRLNHIRQSCLFTNPC